MIACCIRVEIVSDFFQRQRCAVGEEKLLANCSFFFFFFFLNFLQFGYIYKPFRPIPSEWVISLAGSSCEVTHVEEVVSSLASAPQHNLKHGRLIFHSSIFSLIVITSHLIFVTSLRMCFSFLVLTKDFSFVFPQQQFISFIIVLPYFFAMTLL